MAETHEHQLIRYTIYLRPHSWWQRLLGIRAKLTITGVGSSLVGGELLIKEAHGAFYSVNYAGVLWMKAEPVEHKGYG